MASRPDLPPSGRRRRTAPVNSGKMGWVYGICFTTPIKTAAPPQHWPRHYSGWSDHGNLDARLAGHAAGDSRSPRIFQLAREQGIGWDVCFLEPGDRNRERQRKQRSATRDCLICKVRRRLALHRPAAAPAK